MGKRFDPREGWPYRFTGLYADGSFWPEDDITRRVRELDAEEVKRWADLSTPWRQKADEAAEADEAHEGEAS